MKTTEIITIHNTLVDETRKANIQHEIAMNEWHDRKRQLKPTESAFDEPLFAAFKNAEKWLEEASDALNAFRNHDWR